MIARTLTVDVGPDRVDGLVASYREHLRPVHEQADGLHAHYLLANRESGRVTFIGVWEGIGSVQAVADELETARERLWQSFGGAPAVEVYDVADELTRGS